MSLEIEDARWRAFVDHRPEATPFHDPAWARLLADCYGFKPFALALEHDLGGEIVAGIPILAVTGVGRRRRWIALPFTDSVAPLGESEHVARLMSTIVAEQARTRVPPTEIRAAVEGGDQVTRGVVHTLALGPDAEAVRRTFHRSQVQRGIARSERDGVSVRRATDRADLLDTFYSLHLNTRRRQGVPIQPRRFFELLWDRVLAGGGGELLIADAARQPLAAAVFLRRGARIVYKFGASDPSAWDLRPNHAIFWEAIRTGCETGAEELDFGRTDLGNDGLRSFKAGWGTVERPLVYTFVGAPSPESSSGRAERALGVVIRHAPLTVCRILGERLYRYAA